MSRHARRRRAALPLRIDFAVVPDSASCAQMLEELIEEAEALPSNRLVPHLSMRIGCLMYWAKHGLPLPSNLPDILRGLPVMSARGIRAVAMVQRQTLAERQP